MCFKLRTFAVLILFSILSLSEAEHQLNLEARGKKKKIGLFIYFADLIVKKIFILKLIYAFVLWCVIHKAGYFLWWFVSYLKDKKNDHHNDHIPHSAHHEYHEPPHIDYGSPQGQYSYDTYGPYRKSYYKSR